MHWAITGGTGMGKGVIMKRFIIPDHRRRGRKVAVLDPLEAPDWHADFQTADPFHFMRVVKASSNIVAVIDETAEVTSDWKAYQEVKWAATVARNRGILSYFLAQRTMQIPPNIRNQCTNGIIFKQNVADLQECVVLFNEPLCMQAMNFESGLCLCVRPLKTPVKIRVFTPRNG
jgi:hypothetical protein